MGYWGVMKNGGLRVASWCALVVVLAGCAGLVKPLETRILDAKADPGAVGDHYGDPLPGRAVARLGTWRLMMTQPIKALRFGSEARSLVTAGDSEVMVWDTATGRLKGHWRGLTIKGHLDIASTGALVAVNTSSGVALLASDGTPAAPLEEAAFATISPVFSPQARALAAAAEDKRVRIWRLTDRQIAYALEGHEATPTVLAYSPDSDVLASADEGGTIILWDAQSGTRRSSYRVSREAITSMAWSPDSDALIFADASGLVQVIHASTGAPRATLKHQHEEVAAVDFAGPLEAVISGSGEVEVWDLRRVKRSRRLAARGPVAVSEDGRAIASFEGFQASLWSAADGKPWLKLARHTRAVREARFAGRGVVVATTSDDGTVRLWDSSTGGPLRDLPGEAGALTPDGKGLVFIQEGELQKLDLGTGAPLWRAQVPGSRARALEFSADGERVVGFMEGQGLLIWSGQTGALSARVEGTAQADAVLALSPDGGHVALAFGADVRLYEGRYGKEERVYEGVCQGVGAAVRALAVSPDGQQLAAACEGPGLWIGALSSDAEPRSLAVGGDAVSVAYMPGGERLGVGMADGRFELWDLRESKRLARFKPHHGAVNAVDFGLGGAVMLTAGADGAALVWDMGRVQPMRFFAAEGIPEVEALPRGAVGQLGSANLRHEDVVVRVAHAAENGGRRWMATAAVDGTLWLWDATNGEAQASLEGHQGVIRDLRFSSDGEMLVGVDGPGQVHVWRVADGALVKTLSGLSSAATVAALEPSGDVLAVGLESGEVVLFDVAEWELLETLRGHQGVVSDLAFHSRRRRLASSSLDGSVVIWVLGRKYVESKPLMGWRGLSGGALALAYSPDGNTLAASAGDNKITLWDTRLGEETAALSAYTRPSQISFLPDNKHLLTCGPGYVSMWEIKSGQEAKTIELPEAKVTAMSLEPDGARLVTASGDHTVRFWKLPTAQEEYVVPGHAAPVTAIARSSDGALLATGSMDRTVIVWDLKTRTVRNVLRGHADAILDLAFSPSAPVLASAGADGQVLTWSLTDGTSLVRVEAHKGRANALVFTPDGRSLISAGQDGELVMRNTVTGLELARLGVQEQGMAITSMIVVNDGQTLLYGSDDGRVRGWSITRYKTIRTLRAHMSAISHMAYAPQGQRLATSDVEGGLYMWNVNDGEVSFTIDTEPVRAMVFSPDGGRLATVGDDAVHVWDAASGFELLQIPRERVQDLIFSADGKRLFTTGLDTTVFEWAMDEALRYEEVARRRAIKARQDAEATVEQGAEAGQGRVDAAKSAAEVMPKPPEPNPAPGEPEGGEETSDGEDTPDDGSTGAKAPGAARAPVVEPLDTTSGADEAPAADRVPVVAPLDPTLGADGASETPEEGESPAPPSSEP